MFVHVLLFVVGLVLLIKGGDWFVDGAVGVARRFRLPEILIGATVVSIGTTLPEVMVSATSAVQGQSEISYGNAIGSIICNTALIAAIPVVVRPGTVNRKSLKLPVIFFFVAAIFYAVVSYAIGTFSRPVGIALLALFLTYMILSVRNARRAPQIDATAGEGQAAPAAPAVSAADASATTDKPEADPADPTDPAETADPADPADPNDPADAAGTAAPAEAPDPAKAKKKARLLFWKDIAFLVIGAALIAGGANLLVEHGQAIAESLGVPQAVIALTFVALGTSLPELITAISSSRATARSRSET